ncbi:hypothetical protein RHMOL_Rhmol06G0053300 [Rhododendron molle]|uniref:Uncharacterized protein n=1 Tax=Rhododendron molle TaxID=49168 RepID=A0ACC0N912_RHOML|nr:hypothetical protein RHMOL_Rhmol06G0053300 [Rhododendron molle]
MQRRWCRQSENRLRERDRGDGVDGEKECFFAKMGKDCGDCSKWEQDMYWTHFQSIMFLQILPQGFDQQLDIPVKFARNMKRKLPENVTVIGPSGSNWNVGLVASGDTFLFKHGWKEFVEDHSLKEDDVLIFRYNGDSRFDVLIFNGRSFCERESSYFVRKCGHTELDPGFQTKRNKGESPVGVGHDSSDCGEGCTPSKRPRNNENLPSSRLRRCTQAKTGDGASDIMTHHGKRVVEQKVNSAAKEGLVGRYLLQYVSNRKPVTEAEEVNALKMARAVSTPNSFMVVMRPTHVYRKFYMAIPSDWVRSRLPHKSQDVTLRVKENEKTWHAKYECRFGRGASGLVGGWKDFAFENNLEEFDVCLFELASGTHDRIVMDVSIFRVVAESIPSGWAFSHLLHKNQDVILHVKEKENTWHASYYGRVGVNSGGLVGGWKDFTIENNLDEFDVCLFEIASETHDEIVMDVSIFRVVAEVSALTQVSHSPSKRGRSSKYRRKSNEGIGVSALLL